MRTQWTTKGNRDAGSSCSRDRRLNRYLRNFGGGGGLNTPNTPLGTPLVLPSVDVFHYACSIKKDKTVMFEYLTSTLIINLTFTFENSQDLTPRSENCIKCSILVVGISETLWNSCKSPLCTSLKWYYVKMIGPLL